MKYLYQQFYKALKTPEKSIADEHLHLLSEAESMVITRMEWLALGASGLVGALGVLLLYLPQYWLPNWFPTTTISLPVIGDISFSIEATLYGFVLVFAEIWALTLINIYCIHAIAMATGFIDKQNKNTPDKSGKLLAISTEQKDKSVLNYGIDPYQGLPVAQLWLYNALFALKATLSNLIIKIIVRRVLGRYAVREVLDLLGIPIFTFWNIIATRTVLREARVVMMGQNLIDSLTQKFEETAQQTQAVNNRSGLIYDTLQFIAMSKRDYHANHGYLTANILIIFGISTKEAHLLDPQYVEQLATTDPQLRRFCQFVIALGFLLDGQISWREQQRINDLNRKAIIDFDLTEIKIFKKDFLEGRGIESLIQQSFGTHPQD